MFVSLNAAGRVLRTIAAPAATDPYIAGVRYSGDSLCFQAGFAPAGAKMIGGMARDDLGVLYVTLEATPGVPFYNGGMLCDYTGTVYGSVNNAIAGYNQGVPVDALGRICFA